MGSVDVPFADEMARRLAFGLPVMVGNDANLAALAEHTRGVGVGCRDLVYLHGDVGIGGGVIVNGQLLGGHGGYGGEVGHMVVNPKGAPCGCGSLRLPGGRGGGAGTAGVRRPLRLRRSAGTPSAPWSTPPTAVTSAPRRR